MASSAVAATAADQGLAGSNSVSPAAPEAAKAPVTQAAAGADEGLAGNVSAGPAKSNPTSFDPDLIVPKDVDFAAWVPDEQSDKVSKREERGGKKTREGVVVDCVQHYDTLAPNGVERGPGPLVHRAVSFRVPLGRHTKSRIALPRRPGIFLS